MQVTITLILMSFISVFGQKITTDYPTLPTMWEAETIEPGMGKGLESYMFNSKPTPDSPSAMWSNYTECKRLIYIPNNAGAKRYLLGCDAVDCCYEEQDGNQVEFQIPNLERKVDVYHQLKNITNFGEELEADEWSWSFGKETQKWRAYTVPCKSCLNGVKLVQWSSSALGSPWYSIQFKNYHGYSEDNKEFISSFEIPLECQKNNLLACDSNIKQKVKASCGTCGTAYQGCCIGFGLDGYPCDCHLQEGGTGTAGSNCGDCGTAYSACCIGYAADGYPCQCDVY